MNARLKTLVLFLVPLVLLAAVVILFLKTGGAGLVVEPAAPVESLVFERTVLRPGTIELSVRNTSPREITIAVVDVRETIVPFTVNPAVPIPRLGRALVIISYPWMHAEPYAIRVFTGNSIAFDTFIEAAAETKGADVSTLLSFTLIGLYVGVIPVFLGIFWFPALKRLGRRAFLWLMALTVGLLLFLGVDATREALDAAADVGGPFQGVGLTALGMALAVLALYAVARMKPRSPTPEAGGRSRVALMIALGIGLHNLGEGLAIGAAFSIGAASLGMFLVIGFIVQNITEGLGIVAPIVRERPSLGLLAGLGLLGGAPAIAGTWLGGLLYSPILGVLFLSIGAGAVFEVSWRDRPAAQGGHEGGARTDHHGKRHPERHGAALPHGAAGEVRRGTRHADRASISGYQVSAFVRNIFSSTPVRQPERLAAGTGTHVGRVDDTRAGEVPVVREVAGVHPPKVFSPLGRGGRTTVPSHVRAVEYPVLVFNEELADNVALLHLEVADPARQVDGERREPVEAVRHLAHVVFEAPEVAAHHAQPGMSAEHAIARRHLLPVAGDVGPLQPVILGMGPEVRAVCRHGHLVKREPRVAWLADVRRERHTQGADPLEHGVEPGVVDHHVPPVGVLQLHADVFPHLHADRAGGQPVIDGRDGAPGPGGIAETVEREGGDPREPVGVRGCEATAGDRLPRERFLAVEPADADPPHCVPFEHRDERLVVETVPDEVYVRIDLGHGQQGIGCHGYQRTTSWGGGSTRP